MLGYTLGVIALGSMIWLATHIDLTWTWAAAWLVAAAAGATGGTFLDRSRRGAH